MRPLQVLSIVLSTYCVKLVISNDIIIWDLREIWKYFVFIKACNEDCHTNLGIKIDLKYFEWNIVFFTASFNFNEKCRTNLGIKKDLRYFEWNIAFSTVSFNFNEKCYTNLGIKRNL